MSACTRTTLCCKKKVYKPALNLSPDLIPSSRLGGDVPHQVGSNHSNDGHGNAKEEHALCGTPTLLPLLGFGVGLDPIASPQLRGRKLRIIKLTALMVPLSQFTSAQVTVHKIKIWLGWCSRMQQDGQERMKCDALRRTLEEGNRTHTTLSGSVVAAPSLCVVGV